MATRSPSIRLHEDAPSGGCGEQTPCNARPRVKPGQRGAQAGRRARSSGWTEIAASSQHGASGPPSTPGVFAPRLCALPNNDKGRRALARSVPLAREAPPAAGAVPVRQSPQTSDLTQTHSRFQSNFIFLITQVKLGSLLKPHHILMRKKGNEIIHPSAVRGVTRLPGALRRESRRTRSTRTMPAHEDTRPPLPRLLSWRADLERELGAPPPRRRRRWRPGPCGVRLAEPLRGPARPSPRSARHVDAPCDLAPSLSPPSAKSLFVCLGGAAFHQRGSAPPLEPASPPPRGQASGLKATTAGDREGSCLCSASVSWAQLWCPGPAVGSSWGHCPASLSWPTVVTWAHSGGSLPSPHGPGDGGHRAGADGSARTELRCHTGLGTCIFQPGAPRGEQPAPRSPLRPLQGSFRGRPTHACAGASGPSAQPGLGAAALLRGPGPAPSVPPRPGPPPPSEPANSPGT